MYLERKDGQVELIEFTDGGSIGRIVENQREVLSKIIKTTEVEQPKNEIAGKI